MKLFLVGMPGSGKSSVGKKLAEMKGISFYDTDMLIREKYEMTVSEIFNRVGERKFREYEKAMFDELLKKDNFIAATGGGLPCFNDNMNTMNKAGTVVYLKVSIGTLVQRLRLSDNRPLLYGKNDEELFIYLRETLKHRETFYSSAKYVIDAEKDTEDIVISEAFNL